VIKDEIYMFLWRRNLKEVDTPMYAVSVLGIKMECSTSHGDCSEISKWNLSIKTSPYPRHVAVLGNPNILSSMGMKSGFAFRELKYGELEQFRKARNAN
jgi:hypothetical protein